MLTIANLPTQDTYVEALTLGPMQSARAIKYVVANKSVFARIWPQAKDGTIPAPTDELLITPETNIITDAMGIQFRSAVPGVPAQVIAQLLTPGDPLLGSGTPFSATISSSGGIQPGVSAVQIEHNGALVGQEIALNLVDAFGAAFTVTDDAANTRVNVQSVADYVLLGGTQLSVASASVTFSGISAAYRDLVIRCLVRTDALVNTTPLFMRLNGDTAADYDYQRLEVSGAVVSAVEAFGQTALNPGYVVGQSAAQGFWGTCEATVLDYSGTQASKRLLAENAAQWAASAGSINLGMMAGFWRGGAAAVNALTLFLGAGNFVAGSDFAIYGRR